MNIKEVRRIREEIEEFKVKLETEEDSKNFERIITKSIINLLRLLIADECMSFFDNPVLLNKSTYQIRVKEPIYLSRYRKTIEPGLYTAEMPSLPDEADAEIEDFFFGIPYLVTEEEIIKINEVGFDKIHKKRLTSNYSSELLNKGFFVIPDYVLLGQDKHKLTLYELAGNSLLQELKEEGRRDKEIKLLKSLLYPPNKPNKRGERKPNVKSDITYIGKTKAQKIAYGTTLNTSKLTPEQYGGQEIKIKEDSHLSMFLVSKDIEKRLETILNSYDGFLMECAYSVLANNPGSKRIYGSDILKHAGIKRPLQKSCIETVEKAFKSLYKQTNTKTTIDKDIEEARKGFVIRDVIERPLIDADMGYEEYDDGTKDFYLEPKYNPDSDPIEKVFPFIQYAIDLNELKAVDNEMFIFSGRHPARIEQVARFIYRETTGSRKNKETVKLETIINGCDIPQNKNAKTRAKKYVEFVLDDWVKRGYLTRWAWDHKNPRFATSFVVERYTKKAERILSKNCED